MYKDLTNEDYTIAKEYITLRFCLKACKHDKEAMKYKSALKFSNVYTSIIDEAQARIEKRLKVIQRELIRVSKSNTSGVYDVKVGNRQGDMLLDSTEIRLEAERIVQGNL